MVRLGEGEGRGNVIASCLGPAVSRALVIFEHPSPGPSGAWDPECGEGALELLLRLGCLG